MTSLELILLMVIAAETGALLSCIKNIIKRCPRHETPKVITNEDSENVCPDCGRKLEYWEAFCMECHIKKHNKT